MKKILSIMLAVFVLMACSITVFAFPVTNDEISAVNINSAEINCIVKTDGTVEVTEVWNVEYMTAANRFCRVIDIFSTDNEMTLQQRFTIIGSFSVKVDGKELEYAENKKNAYFYSVPDDGENYDIVINYPAAQSVKKIEIAYTLYGAVKKIKNEAVFDYMVIGKGFPYTANDVTVNVTYPSGETDVSIPDNPPTKTETFEFSRVYDLLPVQVIADKKFFEDGALNRYSDFSEFVFKLNKVANTTAPYVFAVAAVAAVILFVLCYDKLVRYSAVKRAKLVIKAKKDDANDLPEDLTACSAYKMLMPVSRFNPKKSAKKVPLLFGMAILECIEAGYIVPDGKNFIVGTPTDCAPAYILSVLNFLKSFCDAEQDRYIIDDKFAQKVTAECMASYDLMANYLATFYSLIPTVSTKDLRKFGGKKRYETAYIVKTKAVSASKKSTYPGYLAKVIEGNSTSNADVFALMFESADKVFTGGKGAVGEITQALGQMYNYYLNVK